MMSIGSSNSSSGTLSTRLNKSEFFIKGNAIDIHMRELRFINNQKVYLDEDTEIPMEKTYDTTNAVQCLATLKITEFVTNNFQCGCISIMTTTILPSDVDPSGLLPDLTKRLSTIGVHLLYNKQINGYQGFALSI